MMDEDDDGFEIQGMAEHQWTFTIKLDEGKATLCVESNGDGPNCVIGTLTHPYDTEDGKVHVEIDRNGAGLFITETIRAALIKSNKIQ